MTGQFIMLCALILLTKISWCDTSTVTPATNSTSSAPAVDTTTTPVVNTIIAASAVNTSTAPVVNTNTGPVVNTTTASPHNTPIAPVVNTTRAPLVNNTTAPFANTNMAPVVTTTTVPFVNTTTGSVVNTTTGPSINITTTPGKPKATKVSTLSVSSMYFSPTTSSRTPAIPSLLPATPRTTLPSSSPPPTSTSLMSPLTPASTSLPPPSTLTSPSSSKRSSASTRAFNASPSHLSLSSPPWASPTSLATVETSATSPSVLPKGHQNPPKRFTCTGIVAGRKWNPNYALHYTKEYRGLERMIEEEVSLLLNILIGFLFVKLIKLWSGSVGFDIEVYFDASSNVTSDVLVKSLNETSSNSSLKLTLRDVKEVLPTTAAYLTTPGLTQDFKLWHLITSITAGVVILFLLIVVVILQKRIKKLRRLRVRNGSHLYESGSVLTSGIYSEQNNADTRDEMVLGQNTNNNTTHRNSVGLTTFFDATETDQSAASADDQKPNGGHCNPSFQSQDERKDELSENLDDVVVSVETSVF